MAGLINCEAMKNGKISRMFREVLMLRTGRRYASSELAKILAVSHRTIFRDMKELRESGVPCHFEKESSSYLLDPRFFMPAVSMDVPEALGLMLLVHKAGGYISLPFMDMAIAAAMKVENNFSSEVKKYCDSALEHISIKAGPKGSVKSFSNLFAQLLGAITKRVVVRLSYHLPKEQEMIETDVDCYHLRHSEHRWYVIGKPDFCKGFYAFSLNQIRHVTKLGGHFIRDKRFDINEYLGKAWAIAPEDKLYHVRLKFNREVVHSVREIQWHSTQSVTYEADGSAIVRFRVDGLDEIIGWVLGFGDKVLVLAPKLLREKITQIAMNIITSTGETHVRGIS